MKSKRAMLRWAIYTRKSTTEGLEDEITSLDVQRQAGEAYIASQAHEGWRPLPERYDDGGYSGANMQRPALERLLADIRAGKVDGVVVYKVDRLSRSLLDFARLMELFDQHRVAFAAVTQEFNTAHSMGRLTLNILLSFAQFERELIAERTRDKIAAARRRGKWAGGMPILGYDVVHSRLVINPREAPRVQAIFDLYLESGSLGKTLVALKQRGWCNKQWVTRKGSPRGGKPFSKSSLRHLLTNVTYVGKRRYKHEVHPGEHEAIIEQPLFERVQALLEQNRPIASAVPYRRRHALLEGLLHCAACASTMGHRHATRGPRRWRYYVCRNGENNGHASCPHASLPAAEMEQFVLNQLQATLEIDNEQLTLRQQRRLLERVVQRVEYDPAAQELVTIMRSNAGDAPRTMRHSVCFPRGSHGRKLLRQRRSFKNEDLPSAPVPRVARLMALAIRFERLVRDGHVTDYAQLARLGRVSRARLTQITGLSLLAPDLQEAILFLGPSSTITERHLRPILAQPDWGSQRRLWAQLAASREA